MELSGKSPGELVSVEVSNGFLWVCWSFGEVFLLIELQKMGEINGCLLCKVANVFGCECLEVRRFFEVLEF
jgi:hypothetical protein